MMNEYEDEEQKFVLEFSAWDKSMQGLGAVGAERPVWEGRIDRGLEKIFEFGGLARLWVIQSATGAYVRNLDMQALSGQFRLIALTNDSDYKKKLLEWWEPGNGSFRGKILFGDDEWDARTVCTDLNVAFRFFRDMYEHGDLTRDSLSQMRSPWNCPVQPGRSG